MIKSVTITNDVGKTFKLELGSPEKSGLAIEKITGLGPGKASINRTQMANQAGSIFNSARGDERNLVFYLIMMECPTIEDSRLKTYEIFPTEKNISITFETDNRTATISGWVESNEPDIFAPLEKTQISILCPDPSFCSPETKTILAGLDSMFEFPFENNSFTENLIELGQQVNDRFATIFCNGETESGVKIHMHFTGSSEMIEIFKSETRESFRIDTDKLETIIGTGLLSGDDVYICTIPNQCGISLVRDNVTTNIINCIDKNADWFHLNNGPNTFTYIADEGVSNFSFDILSHDSYKGI